MSRRVLHFAQDDDTSGYFPQLARWHDPHRFRMLFATLGPMAPWLREHMEASGITCLSCDCRNRAEYPVGMLRLSRFLRQESPEVVHTHLFDPSVIGLAAAVLARRPLRVVTRHYSDYHTRIHKRWHVRLDQLCTRLAHAVIAVSRHTAEHLVTVEMAPAEKVVTILNGIDFDRVRVSAPDAVARLRNEWAPGAMAILLSAARLHPEKGYEHLFRAIAELRARAHRPFVLLVAGRGPFETAYRDLVRQLGCEDVVRFLGFRRDLPDLMAAADVFVLASVAEAFGLVLAEAISLGTPVVATRAGGIPEIVDDDVDGVLVPPGDPASLADALVQLLDHPEKLLRLRGAGRQRIAQRFAFETMVRSYETLYENLLARWRSNV